MNMTWKYVSPIDASEIASIEEKLGISLPDDLKNIVSQFNNGSPSKCRFDGALNKEHVFKTLLSFNDGDAENIFVAMRVVGFDTTRLFPFASDPAGNFICLSDSKVVLWNHESESVEDVADSVTEFINKLY